MRKNIAIIRTEGRPQQMDFYNSQEIGLAKGLATLGYDIDIFMPTSQKQIKTTTIIDKDESKVCTYEMPFFLIPEISQAIYPELIKVLRKKDYSLIHVNEENELTTFLVSRYAKKNNIPCIIYQGMYKKISGRIMNLYNYFHKTFLLPSLRKNITYAFTKTNRAKEYLQRKGFPKIKTIPVGLDTETFNNSEEINWLTDYKIPESSKILLYVGSFEKRRNPGFLLDIAKKLSEKNYFLILAGSGDELKMIQNRIVKERISNVIFVGKVKQKHIKSLYQISDFFLLASDYEIYGMVILEALYCGCPVISTKTAGAEDIITHGEHGLILEDMNVDQWAKGITKYSNHFDRQALTKHIKNKLTWNSIAKKYIEAVFEN